MPRAWVLSGTSDIHNIISAVDQQIWDIMGKTVKPNPVRPEAARRPLSGRFTTRNSANDKASVPSSKSPELPEPGLLR